MQKPGTIEEYQQRIIRVISYIYEHLDEPLDTDKLADIACFSRYHWHRIYHSMTGETATQTVRRLRLHRAAGELVNTETAVSEIADRASYGSVEAFNRAFRRAYQLPPAAFRERSVQFSMNNPVVMGESYMFDVEIKTIEPFQLAAIAHKGSYMESGQAYNELFVWAGPKGLVNDQSRLIGIYYDDPTVVAEDELRMHAGISVSSNFTPDDKTELVKVAGGKFAVLHYKGPYAELSKAYQWLFGQWLPQSGCEAADAPCFEEYINDARHVQPSELLTDIYLPLRG